MASTRYTARLTEPLHALVQEYILSTRTPFAVLIRDALSAYLADTVPTVTPTAPPPADTLRELQMQVSALTTRVEIVEQRQPLLPTAADSADTRSEMQAHLADVTTRVKVIEEILTRWPQLADRAPTDADTGADMVPTPADTAPTPPVGVGGPAVPYATRFSRYSRTIPRACGRKRSACTCTLGAPLATCSRAC